jgi:myo-inositol-1(or 4)-monophosphatase
MDYQNFIESILERASQIAISNFGKVSGSVKSGDNNQVLTETDLEIGKLIVDRIKEAYPKYNVIDEEAGVINNHSDYTWVVDPIDGTSNFAKGIPMYGIFLGLLDKNTPIASGMAIPSNVKIYTAQKGKGTKCNGKKVHVSREEKLSNTLVAYGIDGHQEEPRKTKEECVVLSKIILGIRNLRSSNSAYDFSLLVEGKYGAFLNQTSKIWDNVAAQVLVEEAGGVYTDFYGKPIDYSNPLDKADNNYTYCAAPPVLHKQLQEIIQKAG